MGSERSVKLLRKKQAAKTTQKPVETQDELISSLSSHQADTMRLQQLVGNKAAQKLMAKREIPQAQGFEEKHDSQAKQLQPAAHTHEIQRIEALDNAIGWVKDKLGLTKTEAELAKDLADGLEKAKTVCEKGAGFAPNPEAAERLTRAASIFGDVADGIDTVLKYRQYAEEITEFVDAVNRLNKIDIEKQPMEAADAFGQLFAAAGTLGKHMEGPWSAYFEWLSQARHFFTNVERGLIPSEREMTKRYQDDPDVGPLLR